MLCILWGSSASLVILLPPPPHPHGLDTLLCIYVSGNTGGPHDWSQPTQRGGPTPSSSISVCTELEEAQLPKAKLPPLYPGMVTVAPGGIPATLLYTGVCTTLGRFSLANKITKYVNTEKLLYCFIA